MFFGLSLSLQPSYMKIGEPLKDKSNVVIIMPPLLIITALLTMAWATIHQVSAYRADVTPPAEQASLEYVVVSVAPVISSGTSSEFHAVYGHNDNE